MNVDGKVAVVTGGASGIGRATSLLLAQRGAQVVAADVAIDGAKETVAGIQHGVNATDALQCHLVKTGTYRVADGQSSDQHGRRRGGAEEKADVSAPSMTQSLPGQLPAVHDSDTVSCSAPSCRESPASSLGRMRS